MEKDYGRILQTTKSKPIQWQQRAVVKMNIQPKDTSKGHFYVSLVKSIVRIGAGGCLIYGNLFFAGFLLIFAEVLGIIEELV